MNDVIMDINTLPLNSNIEDALISYQSTGMVFIDGNAVSSITSTPIIYGTPGDASYEIYNPPGTNKVIWNSINKEEEEIESKDFLANIER